MSIYSNAQIGKGTNLADVGIGFSSYGTPIHVGYEHLVTDEIGIGIVANYSTYSDSGFIDDYSWTFLFGGIKGNYHFNEILELNSKFDVYGGLTLGYWKATLENDRATTSNDYGNVAFFTGQVGGRYFFTDHFSALLEAGGGNISGVTLGLSYKF